MCPCDNKWIKEAVDVLRNTPNLEVQIGVRLFDLFCGEDD